MGIKMILNDFQIQKNSEMYELIKPYNKTNLQPHSYDATLDKTIKVAKYNPYSGEHSWLVLDLSQGPVTLEHGQFALASTIEYFKLPQYYVGFVQGKSSIGRNGLQIENAGLIDAGFEGNITLEFYNMAPWPIKLTYGMPICQVHFSQADAPVYTNYSKTGHYNKQTGPTEAVYVL